MPPLQTQLRAIGKDSVIYGIGGAVGGIIGLVLLPVYTRLFTPSEYGLIDLLLLTGNLVAALVNCGLDSSQSYFFYKLAADEGEEAQARMVTSILQWRIVAGITVACVLLASFPWFGLRVFGPSVTLVAFACLLGNVLLLACNRQNAELFRLRKRPVGFLLVSTSATLASALGTFLVVVLLIPDITGYFLGSLIAMAIVCPTAWIANRRLLKPASFHVDLWPKLLKFGAPFITASLAMYFLNSMDRWFIKSLCPPADLGLYAIGAKFAMMLGMLIYVFRQAWWPHALEAMQTEDGKQIFPVVALLYSQASVVLMTCLSAIAPLLLWIFAAPEYQKAYPVIAALGWHAIFYGFFLICCAGIWKSEKTIYIPVTMILAVIVNFVLNFILIKQFGYIGAAIATSASFLVWVLATTVISERLWPVGIQGFRILTNTGIGILLSATITIFHDTQHGVLSISLLTIAVSCGFLHAIWKQLKASI